VLADDIAVALSADGGAPGEWVSQGATADELADRLGRPVEDVSFALFASHGRFRCDTGSPPRWQTGPAAVKPDRAPVAGAPALPMPSSRMGLYPWQADALAAWARSGYRGVVEAVTGTGKTMVGVAAALDELARRGQVVVLVPTVELQRQWLVQLEAHLPSVVRAGRMGAEGGGSLVTHDVLVAVVNSARARDVRPIRRGGLLVADECHRYGSAVNQLALDPRFSRRLGLSATYARDDDGNVAWLDPYFVGTCFRLGYAQAVADGIVASFTVTLVGVQFSPGERARYDELTKEISALHALLVRSYGVPAGPFEELMRTVAVLAAGDGLGAGTARAYRRAMLERRRLLADTPAKGSALRLLAPAVRAADRAIVFTQSIVASERTCRVLTHCGLRAAAMHSALPGRERREILDRFAAGGLDVLSAPRVLDEGVDVPAADLAVIVGASRSRRQMVQRMGRVLRRKADGRRARFAVVFVEGTVEDPALGAHEAFLEEVTDVAESVSCFSAAIAPRRPGALVQALKP
jgi:superfamily II DNA or RNA helicase